jgi:hypothetical protein
VLGTLSSSGFVNVKRVVDWEFSQLIWRIGRYRPALQGRKDGDLQVVVVDE